jgi:hypothetical protein
MKRSGKSVRWSKPMVRIKSVKPVAGYKLNLEFEDGVQGTVDLSPDLYGPMFEPLRDLQLFEQVTIDEYGVVCWPNGADLAPEVLYEEIRTGASEVVKK